MPLVRAVVGAQMHQKPIDLLDLTPETDVEVLVNEIVRKEEL